MVPMGTGTPKALAIIICDTIIDDRDTNKKTLVGVFNNISARKIPFKLPELHVFVSLIEGKGDYKARLECRHRDSSTKVFEVQMDIRFDDPNQVAEINFGLQGAVFNQYGIHDFDFYCDDRIIISRRFSITQIQGNN